MIKPISNHKQPYSLNGHGNIEKAYSIKSLLNEISMNIENRSHRANDLSSLTDKELLLLYNKKEVKLDKHTNSFINYKQYQNFSNNDRNRKYNILNLNNCIEYSKLRATRMCNYVVDKTSKSMFGCITNKRVFNKSSNTQVDNIKIKHKSHINNLQHRNYKQRSRKTNNKVLPKRTQINSIKTSVYKYPCVKEIIIPEKIDNLQCNINNISKIEKSILNNKIKFSKSKFITKKLHSKIKTINSNIKNSKSNNMSENTVNINNNKTVLIKSFSKSGIDINPKIKDKSSNTLINIVNDNKKHNSHSKTNKLALDISKINQNCNINKKSKLSICSKNEIKKQLILEKTKVNKLLSKSKRIIKNKENTNKSKQLPTTQRNKHNKTIVKINNILPQNKIQLYLESTKHSLLTNYEHNTNLALLNNKLHQSNDNQVLSSNLTTKSKDIIKLKSKWECNDKNVDLKNIDPNNILYNEQRISVKNRATKISSVKTVIDSKMTLIKNKNIHMENRTTKSSKCDIKNKNILQSLNTLNSKNKRIMNSHRKKIKNKEESKIINSYMERVIKRNQVIKINHLNLSNIKTKVRCSKTNIHASEIKHNKDTILSRSTPFNKTNVIKTKHLINNKSENKLNPLIIELTSKQSLPNIKIPTTPINIKTTCESTDENIKELLILCNQRKALRFSDIISWLVTCIHKQ